MRTAVALPIRRILLRKRPLPHLRRPAPRSGSGLYVHSSGSIPPSRAQRMPIILPESIPNLTALYKLGQLEPAASQLCAPNKELNDKVALHRGDITKLAV